MAERTLRQRLGFMADAVVSAKVGPQARFFTRDCADELALLLREAEKALMDLQVERRAGLVIDRDATLRRELQTHLDTIHIDGSNIGEIRHSLFLPWDSSWNGWVRDETASREGRG